MLEQAIRDGIADELGAGREPEAEWRLSGPPQRNGYVIVDEAQDLTPMQLRMISRRAMPGAITLLGDIAQATGVWRYDRWDELLSHLDVLEGAELRSLTYGYRVPVELMEIADRIPALIEPDLPLPTHVRPGEAPMILEVSSDFVQEETAYVSQSLSQEATGSIAIIAAAELMDPLRVALVGYNVKFSDAAKGELGERVSLLTPRAAKGLEFDHVVVVEPIRILEGAESMMPLRELYVAMTRATHGLTIIHAEPLPFPLDPDAEPILEPTVEPPATPASRVSARFDEALTYARVMRFDDDPMHVAADLAAAGLVLARGYGEDSAIATLLNDTADESHLTEIRRFFGPAVADLVHDPSGPILAAREEISAALKSGPT